jgi:hypothetical protein
LRGKSDPLDAYQAAHRALFSGKGPHCGRQSNQRPSRFSSGQPQGEVPGFEDPDTDHDTLSCQTLGTPR